MAPKYPRGSLVVIKRHGRTYEGIVRSHSVFSSNCWVMDVLVVDGLQVLGGFTINDAHDNFVIEVKRSGPALAQTIS